ncbi:MAG: YceI family protein [Myxococcales bacterium]
MNRYDARTAEVNVYSFKEGALSSLAHDLKLRVNAFELDVDPESGAVRATLDAASLAVVCTMNGGREAASLLGPAQFDEIARNVRTAVLHADRFPAITLTARREGAALVGELELHGVRRPIRGTLREAEGSIEADFELDQRDFGITPYKALLGALKVQPRIRVVARVPRPR